MYDCNGPVLVFVTQTHHPLLEHHTGYIFAMYEFHYTKPRELFFQHMHEAQVFALYKDARLEMRADQAPDRISVLNYSINDSPDDGYPEALQPEDRSSRAVNRRHAAARGYAKRMRVVEVEELEVEKDPEIDFFGEDLE